MAKSWWALEDKPVSDSCDLANVHCIISWEYIALVNAHHTQYSAVRTFKMHGELARSPNTYFQIMHITNSYTCTCIYISTKPTNCVNVTIHVHVHTALVFCTFSSLPVFLDNCSRKSVLSSQCSICTRSKFMTEYSNNMKSTKVQTLGETQSS